MPIYRYLHLDVFTATPFEGNQLAVFPDAADMDAHIMQTVTREMNFSECTFLFRPEGSGDVRMRIFTPDVELPIAGHPTIGTTFALASEGAIVPGRRDFVYELGVGPTPVSLEWNDRGLAFAWMTQPLPAFGERPDPVALAAALGVGAHEMRSDLPPQVVSCGVPYLLVALTSRAAVDAVQIDRRALVRCFKDAGADEKGVFVFTTEGSETAYSRMLGDAIGIAEDPATGSACGPLGCYLLHYKAVSPEAARGMLNVQGVAMKRRSHIHISIDSEGDRITRVRVGGQAVLVGKGEVGSL